MVRRTMLVIAVAAFTIAWWWVARSSQYVREESHNAGAYLFLEPSPTAPLPAPSKGAPGPLYLYDTPEVYKASNLTRRFAKSQGYVLDAWRSPHCNGVTVFYQPLDLTEDIAWYWYDLDEEEFTAVLRLPDLLEVLSPYLDNLRYPEPHDISIMHLPDSPRYAIARAGERLQYFVEVRFSLDRCSPLPDQAFVSSVVEQNRLPVDLAAALQDVFLVR